MNHPMLSDCPEGSFQFQHYMPDPGLRQDASAVSGEICLQVGALTVLED